MTETKSTEIFIDSLKKSGFQIIGVVDSAYYAGDTLTKRGLYFGPSDVSFDSKWTISGSPCWISFVKTRFWAWKTVGNVKLQSYSDSTLCGNSSFSFDYQVKSDGDGDDLLFAYNDIDYDVIKNKNAELNLSFAHPMARINFMVTPEAHSATQTSGTFRNDYKLVDITLKEVCDTGHCAITGVKDGYPTFSWSALAGNVSCTKTFNTTFESSTPPGWEVKKNSTDSYISNESIFIIPQTIGPTTSLAVTFCDTLNHYVTKSSPLKNIGGATQWQAGKYYTYRIAISGDITSYTSFSVSLDEWGTTEEDKYRF